MDVFLQNTNTTNAENVISMSTCIPTTCIQWDREPHSWAILASQWYNSKVTLVVIVKPSMWGIISQANYRLALVQLAHTCRKSPWYSLTFSSCHWFSIGLASGLSGGVRHQFTPFWSKNAFAILEVYFGSLSCIKWWLFSYSGHWSVGRRATCRICTYTGASIMPSKTQISVAPCHSSCSRISYGTLAVRSFHLTTQHPQSRREGKHKPIQAVSLCSLGKSVGSTLTLSMFSPVHVGPAGWCLVTTAYGHAAASRNVFELQLLCRQLALSLRWSSEGHRCARSPFQILFACQCCQSQDNVCGNVCIVTRITVAPSRFSVSTTSRLAKPLSFKETILSWTYFNRIAKVSLSELNQHITKYWSLRNSEPSTSALEAFHVFRRNHTILRRSLPICESLPVCGSDRATNTIQKNISEERRHFLRRIPYVVNTANC